MSYICIAYSVVNYLNLILSEIITSTGEMSITKTSPCNEDPLHPTFIK